MTENVASSKSELFSEHYAVLRRMAHARLRPHKTFTLLGTTGLVHESYLRLASSGNVPDHDHAHFLGYVGRVMRSVIVDAAREKLTQRRGQGAQNDDFDDALAMVSEQPATEIVKVHDALLALSDAEPQLAKVLELEYFAGMTEAEIATCLTVTDRTVRRHSSKAHALLRAMMA